MPIVAAGRLDVYEDGFALVETGLAPLVVSFSAGDVAGATEFRANGQHVLALDLTPQGASRLAAFRPAGWGLPRIGLAVRETSPAKDAMSEKLAESWRPAMRRCGQGPPSDDLKGAVGDAVAACFAEEALGLARGVSVDGSRDLDVLLEAYDARSGDAARARLLGPLTPVKPVSTGPDCYALVGEPGAGVADVAAALVRRGKEDDGKSWHHVEAAVDGDRVARPRGPSQRGARRTAV